MRCSFWPPARPECRAMPCETSAERGGMWPGAAAQIKFYLALEKGLFTDMAAKTALALQGMSPKINIWTQGGAGGEAGAAGDALAPLRNLFTSLPPMLVGSMLGACFSTLSSACNRLL